MSVLDRAALESSPLADLHAIASELSIDGYRRLRRAELIDAILERQGGDDAATAKKPARRSRAKAERPAAKKAEAKADADADQDEEEDEEEEERDGRRRRGRRGGRGRSAVK